MSITTDYVGHKSLVDLHATGLKRGEELASDRLSGLDCGTSTAKALRNPIAQDFTKEQKGK